MGAVTEIPGKLEAKSYDTMNIMIHALCLRTSMKLHYTDILAQIIRYYNNLNQRYRALMIKESGKMVANTFMPNLTILIKYIKRRLF